MRGLIFKLHTQGVGREEDWGPHEVLSLLLVRVSPPPSLVSLISLRIILYREVIDKLVIK